MAFGGYHDGADALAPVYVFYADDGGFFDGGVGV